MVIDPVKQVTRWDSCELAAPAHQTISRTSYPDGREAIVVAGEQDLPSGPLFTCQLQIAAETASGVQPLTVAASAVDESDAAIPLATVSSVLEITSCNADCDGNGEVNIGEVIKAMNHFGGLPLCHAPEPSRSCPAADSDYDGQVTIGEIVQSLSRFGSTCDAR